MADTDDLIQIALDSNGEPFLAAEQRLLELGETAAAAIQARLGQEKNPFGRLVLEMLRRRLAADEVVPAILTYFDQARQRAAATALRTPPPVGVANYLEQHFGEKAAPFVGVYAVKLAQSWAGWKVIGSVLYLGRTGPHVAGEALLRFATLALPANYREAAREALVAVADNPLLGRLREETAARETALVELQQVVERIEQKLGSGKG